mgnify:CR=1 FL=1
MLDSSEDGTRVHVAIVEIEAGRTHRLPASDRTQVVYILEGRDARITHTSGRRRGRTRRSAAVRRLSRTVGGGDGHRVQHSTDPAVGNRPEAHRARPRVRRRRQAISSKRRSSDRWIDEKRIRERTFWVNTETGLSGSWDLQLGRMLYAPHGHSPRHVHQRLQDQPGDTGALLPDREGRWRSEARYRHASRRSGQSGPHPRQANGIQLDRVRYRVSITSSSRRPSTSSPRWITIPWGKLGTSRATDDGTGKPKLWAQSRFRTPGSDNHQRQLILPLIQPGAR